MILGPGPMGDVTGNLRVIKQIAIASAVRTRNTLSLPKDRSGRFVNWDRSQVGRPREWRLPTTEDEVVELVATARAQGRHVRAVGAGHSWSPVALPEDIAVSLDQLRQAPSIDYDASTITLSAGMRLRDLTAVLSASGLALPIIGSIQSQSAAGAIATGTHGSSLRHGNLATLVVGLRFVTGTGELLTIHLGDERLSGLRVHLGALGVVTSVTLQVCGARRLRRTVEHVPVTTIGPMLSHTPSTAEYVKVWWLPHTSTAQVIRYDATTEAVSRRPSAATLRVFEDRVVHSMIFPAVASVLHHHPPWTAAFNRAACTRYAGPASQIGSDMLMLTTATPFRHRETEAAIPVADAGDAFHEIVSLFRHGRPAGDFPVDVRFVRADDSWLSPAEGRDTCQIGAYATNGPDCQSYFDRFWKVMRASGARPHWGKEFDHDGAELSALYPHFDQFLKLREVFDPDRIFASALHTRVLGS
jgi:FAD/FMN-containing dehydrogenase